MVKGVCDAFMNLHSDLYGPCSMIPALTKWTLLVKSYQTYKQFNTFRSLLQHNWFIFRLVRTCGDYKRRLVPDLFFALSDSRIFWKNWIFISWRQPIYPLPVYGKNAVYGYVLNY